MARAHHYAIFGSEISTPPQLGKLEPPRDVLDRELVEAGESLEKETKVWGGLYKID
jgi:hypothetical protein